MNICNQCNNECHGKKDPCGCAEPVFSIEAMPDDPTVLRFNVNGKSVWYDFDPVIKDGETATTLVVDGVNRTLNHYGERSTQTITAKELGAILHLADIGDIDSNSIKDNGILNYRKNDNCPEGCVGTSNNWVSSTALDEDVASSSMNYLSGADPDGKLKSLTPPSDATTFSYLAWKAANKIGWTKPTVVSTPPVKDGKVAQLYLDENTGEIVIVRKEAE